MRRFPTSLMLMLVFGLGTESATALGLGKAQSVALLGQPLQFTIGLRVESGETLETRCAKAEVSFGERVVPDAVVRTRLETSSATGERRLRVITTMPVDEPVVGVTLQLGCPVNLSRSYTLLADPPGAAQSGAAQGSDAWVAERAETAVSPILAAAAPEPSASTPAPPTRPRKRRGDGAVSQNPSRSAVVAAAGEPSAPRAVRRQAQPPARPRGGPVLRLDPVEADALIAPSLQMDTRLSSIPEASASAAAVRALDPDQAQRLQDQERLKAMEAALLKLRTDSQATQKSLEDMRLRVRAAEAGRYANPLVYLLSVLCVLLAGGLVTMWWLRRRDRAAAHWWADQAANSVAPVPEPGSNFDAAQSAPTVGLASAPQPLPPVPVLADAVPEPARAVPAPTRAPEPQATVIEPRRPMSAEELIDLEQQAEFFVVLGQDDAAIDLLMGHVRSTGGVSPLPYLKLLEIYRRRGEQEPYDRIRERFNRRFNAYAPEWGVDPEEGLSLEGYPEVMKRLQDAWNRPSQAMELLDGALFRRDAGPTFDVPAYRELLFLYSTARDLAERDLGPEGVDLLLPMGDEPASMMSSVPASAPPASFSLDLDVSTDQPPHLSLDDPGFKQSER